MTLSRKHLLLATVFLTGAAVLIVEVAATRILSPYFGNTIFTVSSVISVILAALSLGYALGGRLADKHPSLSWFFGIIFWSGMSILIMDLLTLTVLPQIGYRLSAVSGPLLSAILLFFAPSLLLGMLSPFAIKLQHLFVPEEGLGTLSGEVFFWSTLGSIAGSLASGFILIPRFGLHHISLATGIGVALLGLIPLLRLGRTKAPPAIKVGIILIALGALASLSSPKVAEGVRYSKDGLYERIVVRDLEFDGRPTRFLIQDRSLGGGVRLDREEMAFDYTKYFTLYRLIKPELGRALAIGGGAYTIPRELLKENDRVTVDVVEIEPMLHGLAKQYFGLPDDPRLTNHVTDGRRFLHDSATQYDLIFSDVYYSLFSIPAHVTTREFLASAKSHLTENGVFMANVVGSLETPAPSVVGSVLKTVREVFPNSYALAVESPSTAERQNIMVVGVNGNVLPDWNAFTDQADADPILRDLNSHLIDPSIRDLSRELILTDDYAPVDRLTAKEL